MNEESLSIIVSQKRELENLHEYIDAGFKIICDWGKKDQKRIKFLSFCFGVMAYTVYRQGVRLKKLEKQIEEMTKEELVENMEDTDPVEEVSAE